MRPTPKKFSQHREALTQDWRNIKNAFSDTAADAANMADDVYDQTIDHVKNQSSELQQNITGYVKKNPMQALGIALFAGFIIGCWWKK